ncbi:MAG: succinate-semialdehyde dehydrogenase [Candidatus Midichloriaceae bacterium]|jgi:succinate-semialdehyde dehydrogenase/glutarate-semialdehyde dehydrogenase|nr:succinate-semialdehyde dehydrogenase [Candidatus Midichloriaceae bacterium]
MKFDGKSYLDGKWISGSLGKEFSVINPADMSSVASISSMGEKEASLAVSAAAHSFTKWRLTLGKERGKILRNLYDLMLKNRDHMAKIMVLENGKTLAEAYSEVDYSCSFVEWFAEEAKRIYGDMLPSIKHGQKLFVISQPIGVVAAITPWNFPLAMLARKVAPCLAAGCTMVIKPASETPLSALYFIKLCEEAGVPAGVLNIVCGDPASIGDVFCAANEVKMLTFTGSTPIGKMLMSKASQTVKKVALELGGNAPFIVFEDADLEKAVAGLISSKLRNGGQSCICANRVYVARSMLDKFNDLLVSKFSELKVGNGMDANNHIGPMTQQASVRKINSLLKDSIDKNGEVLYSVDISEQLRASRCYAAPTVILNKAKDLSIENAEIFGPIVSLFPFDTEEEVITRANNTNYGLASYFYSENKDRIWRVSESLEYGMVGINDVAISSEIACFGGVKESGLGREGGNHGITEYLEHKYLVMS